MGRLVRTAIVIPASQASVAKATASAGNLDLRPAIPAATSATRIAKGARRTGR